MRAEVVNHRERSKRADALCRVVRIVLWVTMASPGLAADVPPELQPIFEIQTSDGIPMLADESQLKLRGLPVPQARVAFRAASPSPRIPGLVPVYAHQTKESFSLARRPRRGHENSTEPLFLALPNTLETNAAVLAGRWECEGTHADGAKDYFAWELSMEGDQVFGRFDPNTDYRFAYLTGGSFHSNRLTLHIDYISNQYVATGVYRKGTLAGEWRQTTGADHGTWTGNRASVETDWARLGNVRPLYQWRRMNAPSEYRYSWQAPSPSGEWIRDAEPLCRVWMP